VLLRQVVEQALLGATMYSLHVAIPSSMYRSIWVVEPTKWPPLESRLALGVHDELGAREALPLEVRVLDGELVVHVAAALVGHGDDLDARLLLDVVGEVLVRPMMIVSLPFSFAILLADLDRVRRSADDIAFGLRLGEGLM